MKKRLPSEESGRQPLSAFKRRKTLVLDDKQTHIAYRCPHCGQAVLGFVGKFALSADMLKLKCPCKKSELVMTYTAEKKVRLSVPCLFCPTPHQFVVSQPLFFGRELFLLNCPYANMDICFIGSEEKLGEALEENAKELNQLYETVGVEETEEEETPYVDPETFLPDAQVYDVVRFLVKELQEDGAIDCPCHGGDYDFTFIEGGVRVYCRECGALHDFPACSVETAQAFLACDELMLEFPEGQNPFQP